MSKTYLSKALPSALRSLRKKWRNGKRTPPTALTDSAEVFMVIKTFFLTVSLLSSSGIQNPIDRFTSVHNGVAVSISIERKFAVKSDCNHAGEEAVRLIEEQGANAIYVCKGE
jgi:hypothetical protein